MTSQKTAAKETRKSCPGKRQETWKGLEVRAEKILTHPAKALPC